MSSFPDVLTLAEVAAYLRVSEAEIVELMRRPCTCDRMEVHGKHPICLGGDPIDKDNKVLVPPAKHADAGPESVDVMR